MVFCNEFISMNFSKAQEIPTKKKYKKHNYCNYKWYWA